MLAGIRFLWNATRGHRLRPWRSEYIRWRIETYSGIHAEDMDGSTFAVFLVREKSRLAHFLLWTIRMARIAKQHTSIG